MFCSGGTKVPPFSVAPDNPSMPGDSSKIWGIAHFSSLQRGFRMALCLRGSVVQNPRSSASNRG
jgi:hypothetical protein